jgi:hypothetical protein
VKEEAPPDDHRRASLADILFLALGVGAFALFWLFAAGLRRI